MLASILRGLSFGSVYALLAVGLVLAYRTTGVFNLAFGPQAFLAAAVYYDTHVTHGWPMWAGVAARGRIVSPLVGVILDRLLFRFLRNASETAKLVSVLGLFVAIPQMIFLWFGTNAHSNAEGIVPNGSVTYKVMTDVYVSRDDLVIVVGSLLAFAALTAVLRYSAIGLRMRAVVESSRLTELAGVDAERSSLVSWALSSAIAGLAGVLLAPVFAGQVDYISYQTLVIAAIAAAALGGLTSMPYAYLGGLALGVTQQLLSKYLPDEQHRLERAAPGAAVRRVVRRAWRSSPRCRAGARSPTRSRVSTRRRRRSRRASARPSSPRSTRIAAVTFCAVVGYWLFFHADESWVGYTITGRDPARSSSCRSP